MSPNAPTVFISYSHDSAPHKEWVRKLAERLTKDGVYVLLDQWDTGPGDDLGAYMHRSVRNADRVVMVCTPSYISKANDGKGGVGFEALIVTAEIVRNAGTPKFVPIIRVAAEPERIPGFMGYRYHVDFTDDGHDAQDTSYDNLVREIHKAPINPRPDIGSNPFAVTPSGAVIAPQHRPARALQRDALSLATPEEFFEQAQTLAASGDLPKWRMLTRAAKKASSLELSRLASGIVMTNDRAINLQRGLDLARGFSPIFAVALGGTLSGQADFRNQAALINDILNPDDWPRAGLTSVVRMPDVAAFAFQALLGSAALFTGQYDLARQLANTQVEPRNSRVSHPLYAMPSLISCPVSLEAYTVSWSFLCTLYESWSWLEPIFQDNEEYLASLTAYYMLLNVDECMRDVKQHPEIPPVTPNQLLKFDTSVQFLSVDESVGRLGYRYLIHNIGALRAPWNPLDEMALIAAWPNWLEHVRNVFARQRDTWDPPDAYFQRLPDDLMAVRWSGMKS